MILSVYFLFALALAFVSAEPPVYGPPGFGGSGPGGFGGGSGGYGGGHSGGGDGAPQPFNFQYEVKDPASGNDFGHQASSPDGKRVQGEYFVLLPDGRRQIVKYTADDNGYNADVRYEGQAKYPQAGGAGGFGGSGGGYPSGGGAGGFGGYHY